MHKETTWVLVASNKEARLFCLTLFPEVESIGFFDHPEGRLHNRDFDSDAPGRSFQRGGVKQHSYQSAHSSKEESARRFVKHLSTHMIKAFEEHRFSRLYLIAPPALLGLLREHLHPKLKNAIVSEIPKDLQNFSSKEISSLLKSVTP